MNIQLDNVSSDYRALASVGMMARRDVAAFTLIELILALAVAAIVLASVNGVLFGALKLRNDVSDAAAQALPVDMAINIMKRDLTCIVPPGILAGQMGSDAISQGLTQPLMHEIFTSSGTLSADNPFGDVQKIDYYMQDPVNGTRGSGRDLIRGVTRNLLATTTVAPDPQLLMHGVQTAQFSYYDGTNWNDVWSTMLSNIPVAIRVTIAFPVPPKGEAVKPPLQFLVPVVAWANTNSIANQVSN